MDLLKQATQAMMARYVDVCSRRVKLHTHPHFLELAQWREGYNLVLQSTVMGRLCLLRGLHHCIQGDAGSDPHMLGLQLQLKMEGFSVAGNSSCGYAPRCGSKTVHAHIFCTALLVGKGEFSDSWAFTASHFVNSFLSSSALLGLSILTTNIRPIVLSRIVFFLGQCTTVDHGSY